MHACGATRPDRRLWVVVKEIWGDANLLAVVVATVVVVVVVLLLIFLLLRRL